MSRPSVLVVGGGVAGIAAAVRLSDAGHRVTLIETRKRLGGRATSHVDPSTGELIDNCQHVLMRCCTALLELYNRLGVADRIDWHRTIHFADALEPHTVYPFEGDDLPAPAHLARALLGLGFLSWRDKLAIGWAMTNLRRLGRDGRKKWHDRSFADWLATQFQPQSAIDRFWSTVIVSACNATPDRCAADYAMQVFQDGFMADESSYEMGLSRVPLAELYDAAGPIIEQAGGELRLGASASALKFDGSGVTGLHTDGDTLHADIYISALPPERLARLCSPAMVDADARLRQLEAFEVSPIVGVHLWFAGPVMMLPHLALVNSPLHWLFVHADTDEGQHLHGVISAADALVDQPADAIVELVLAETGKVLPRAKEVALRRSRVIKEKRATFLPVPGVDALRPAATGAISNLLLAGDWCDTGWPATMEGAARSGFAAAGSVL